MWWAFLLAQALMQKSSTIQSSSAAATPAPSSVAPTPGYTAAAATPAPSSVAPTPGYTAAAAITQFINYGPAPAVNDIATAIISGQPWIQAVENPQSLINQGLSNAQILALAGWPSGY